MEQLHHRGVLVPPRYRGRGLTIKVRGEKIRLTDEQEEMAVAWAKKMGTLYVEDPIFARNFHRDFSAKLGIDVKPGDVDYSEVLRVVEEERERKANLTKEEKKRLREERKAIREANKEKYGWATVDGVRMEIGNYTVEPSSIFMGRGRHPMRGRWKEGPRHGDIELNLSPDAPRPPGDWKAVVWEPDAMWIARWRDRLSGKMKYVWLSDSSRMKQRRDIEKFEKAKELGRNLRRVRRHILENLDAEDPRRRRTATVCYLIDRCKFRVGDEKDEDEADTVGASTLRPEHIRFNGDGTVTFDFLGKDSVRHLIRAEMPEQVVRNLREFSEDSESRYHDKLADYEEKLEEHKEKLEEYNTLLKQREKKGDSTESLEKLITSKKKAINSLRKRIRKLKKIGPTLFDEVNSPRVSDFLDEVMTGLSAKVFRTHYSTTAVESKLKRAKVGPEDPDYIKKHAATMANLEAAKVCNHRRTIPKTWETSLQRKKDRLKARRARAKENERKIRQRAADAEKRFRERLRRYEERLQEQREKLEEYRRQLEEKRKQGRSVRGLERRIESKRNAVKTQEQRIRKLKATHAQRMKKLREQLNRRRQRDRAAVEKLKLQIKAQRETRDYNLGTSLKSYIDPRTYHEWGRRVDYDWRRYYPKTLQKKFSWVETGEGLQPDRAPR